MFNWPILSFTLEWIQNPWSPRYMLTLRNILIDFEYYLNGATNDAYNFLPDGHPS